MGTVPSLRPTGPMAAPFAAIEQAVGEPVEVLVMSRPGSKNHGLSVSTMGREGLPGFDRVGRMPVASISWSQTTGVIAGVLVEGKYQRKGIATALLELARASDLKPEPVHSDVRTTDGAAWIESLGSVTYHGPEDDGTRPVSPAADLQYRMDTDDRGGWVVADDPLRPGHDSEVASLSWLYNDDSGSAVIQGVWVLPPYQRQGVATKMLEMARDEVDYDIEHDTALSSDGRAWAQHVGAKDPTLDPSFGGQRTSRKIDGITYAFSTKAGGAFDTGAFVTASQGGKHVGHINIGWQGWSPKGFVIQWVEVNPEHQRKGIASNMLALAREQLEPWAEVRHDTALSTSGRPWAEKVGTKAYGLDVRYAEVDASALTTTRVVVAYVEFAPGDYSTVGFITWDRSDKTIELVGVTERERGKGIGSALLAHALQIEPGLKPTGERSPAGTALVQKRWNDLPDLDRPLEQGEADAMAARMLVGLSRFDDQDIVRKVGSLRPMAAIDPERKGMCYVLAGNEASHGGGTLVHGSIQGGGNPRIGHAWVVRPNGNVWDPVLDEEFPAVVHEHFFSPQVDATYTTDEVLKNTLRTGHWGPWDDIQSGIAHEGSRQPIAERPGNRAFPHTGDKGNGGDVPASTSINRNRVGNIDTDRLLRRREFLRDLIKNRSHTFEQRREFVWRAAELHAIENELERRGELPDERITLRAGLRTEAGATYEVVEDLPAPAPMGSAEVRAYVGGAMVGKALLTSQFWPSGSYRAWSVWNIFVEPEHQRKGIARGMMEALHAKHPADKILHQGFASEEGAAFAESLPPSWNRVKGWGDSDYRRPRSAALKTGPQTYWRVHPAGRDWADATSTQFSPQPGEGTRDGFSCMDDPWRLWAYVFVTWAARIDSSARVVAFTGRRIGTGHDGEDLVLPTTSGYRSYTWESFCEELLTTPIPPTPAPVAPSWSAFCNMMRVGRDSSAQARLVKEFVDGNKDDEFWRQRRFWNAETLERTASAGVTYRVLTGEDGGRVEAMADGKQIGWLSWSFPKLESWKGRAAISDVAVQPEYRRRGIATEMLTRARAAVDYPIEHSPSRTGDGDAWAAKVAVRGTVTEPVPLDYPYPGTPLRFAIYFPEAGPSDDHYFEKPGLVAFLDTFTTADETLIAYMSVRRDHRGKGLARKLVQAVYDHFDTAIDWGEVVEPEAGSLWKSFSERYPDRGNHGKQRYRALRTAASERIYYHGSGWDLPIGSILVPNSDPANPTHDLTSQRDNGFVHFTTDPDKAAYAARYWDGTGDGRFLYVVEPIGEVTEGKWPNSFMAPKARIVARARPGKNHGTNGQVDMIHEASMGGPMADEIREHLLDLHLPAQANDGDCLPVSGEVVACLQEHGWADAHVAFVTGYGDFMGTRVVLWAHVAAMVEGRTIVDATATQYDSSLPSLIIETPERYKALMAAATGAAEVEIATPSGRTALRAEAKLMLYHVTGDEKAASILAEGLKDTTDSGYVWAFTDPAIAQEAAATGFFGRSRGANTIIGIDPTGLHVVADPHPGWGNARPGWDAAARAIVMEPGQVIPVESLTVVPRTRTSAIPPQHASLYPAVFDPETNKVWPQVRDQIRFLVNSHLPSEAQGHVRLWLQGSGASYNYDAHGDLDVQVWVALETPEGTTLAVRDALTPLTGTPMGELGMDGSMAVQFYVKAGDGTAADNLAQKPYALYDLDNEVWAVEPVPQTPEMYGRRFEKARGPALVFAKQIESVLDDIAVAEASIAFAAETGVSDGSDRGRLTALQAQARSLHHYLKKARADAYRPGGEGIEDIRDSIVKVLETWGVWQRLQQAVEAADLVVA